MHSSLIVSALLAVVMASAHAQPNPADPSQAGIAPTYRSAFADYQLHQDPSTPSLDKWRAANDLVGALGGHAGHIASDAESNHSGAHQHAGQPAQKPAAPTPASEINTEHGGHHHAH